MESEDPSNTPKYFYLLGQTDKDKYRRLQTLLLHATEKRHRGHRLDIFLDCLQKIRNFCQRGDEDDWKRCCVCGVCFLKCGIALNSHQMKFLTNKCKSSINGALKMMKYKTTSARGDINPELVDFLPILKGNTNELRQWSVRTPDNYLPPVIDKPLLQQEDDKTNSSQFDITLNMAANSNTDFYDTAINLIPNSTRLLSGSEEEEITEASDISNSPHSIMAVPYQNDTNERHFTTINTKANYDERENPGFKSGSVIITDKDVHIIGTDKHYTSLTSNASMNINDTVILPHPSCLGNDSNSKAALSLDDFDIVPSHCLNEINDNTELIEISCLSAEKPKELYEDFFTNLMF